MPNNLLSNSLPELDPISIDRLTSYIEQALLQTPQLRQVWVSGEVSSATHHPSGIYFNLKDKVGKASLPAVIWKSQIPELETKPQIGMEVLAFGRIASCFNSEIVVRAIAECPIPIITGIGHERDQSLADLAADLQAATPTAAAILVVPDLEDLADEHFARVERLRSTMQRVLIERQSQLNQLRIRCERIRPDRQLKLEADRLVRLQRRLKLAIAGRLQTAKQQQLRLTERLNAFDPRLVLQRGYALVRDNNETIVRDGDRLAIGAELSIQFGNGRAQVRVVEIDGKEN